MYSLLIATKMFIFRIFVFIYQMITSLLSIFLCLSWVKFQILLKYFTSVGSWNEKSVYKYELFVFNIDEIELFVFIGVENEQFVFNGIENAHLLYPLNSPFRINIWGGEECPLPVLSQTRILAPPLSDRFCKKSEKIRIDSEWPETARNRKKKFAPWWPPQKKTYFEKGLETHCEC